MKARAPGKLVLSGAYAVLDGAPALVAAVDRYVTADSDRAADFVAPEVREALSRRPLGEPPWFDASALRAGDRKLGLGSSAAILAASLAALWPTNESLAASIFPLALASHRAAQGGGSGVDVAAACHGGVLCCTLVAGELKVASHTLPAGIVLEVWSCPESTATRVMLAAVRALRDRDGARYQGHMDEVEAGALAARDAGGVAALVAAVGTQWDALRRLGDAASAPIVTGRMRRLNDIAVQAGARFGPSGAGGGDVALWIGADGSPPQFRARAERAGLCLLDLHVGAPGVQRLGA